MSTPTIVEALTAEIVRSEEFRTALRDVISEMLAARPKAVEMVPIATFASDRSLNPATAERRRSRFGEPFRGHDYSGKRWRDEDLPALGWRHRRHYDMRATFITLAIEDGADPEILETRVTHTRKSATRSTATTAGCTGSERVRRSRSFASRAAREARRSSSRSRPELASIRCNPLQPCKL